VTRLPNFLHIGPGKSGSTWLHETLVLHPQVYLSEAKDLYFFSRYYDRGVDWYRKQFRSAQPSYRVVGEVCPDYLTSAEAPQRIRSCLGPDVRLMVTLRDPAERAFSAYLHRRKHGLTATFREDLETSDLIEEGRYGTQLQRYLDCFGRQALHVAVFDDLRADPQAFLDGVTTWLQIDRQMKVFYSLCRTWSDRGDTSVAQCPGVFITLEKEVEKRRNAVWTSEDYPIVLERVADELPELHQVFRWNDFDRWQFAHISSKRT